MWARPCATFPDTLSGDLNPERQLHGQARPTPRGAIELEGPVERRDAIGEPGETTAVAEHRASHTVVGDLDVQPFRPLLDRDRGARGVRVLDDVRERL